MTWTKFVELAERLLMFPEKLLTVRPFPGFSSKPDVPAPLPPPPKLDDPAVDTAREKLRLSEKRRKGRRASILTSGRGVDDSSANIRRSNILGATGALKKALL